MSGRKESGRQLYPYGIALHVGKLHKEQLLEVEHEEVLSRLGIYAAYLVGIHSYVGFTPRQCVAVHTESIVAQQPALGYVPAGMPVVPVVGVGHAVPERRLLVGKGIFALAVGRHGYPHRVNVDMAQLPLVLRQKGSARAGCNKSRAACNSKKTSKIHVKVSMSIYKVLCSGSKDTDKSRTKPNYLAFAGRDCPDLCCRTYKNICSYIAPPITFFCKLALDF